MGYLLLAVVIGLLIIGMFTNEFDNIDDSDEDYW